MVLFIVFCIFAEKSRTMPTFFPPEINGLLGIFLIVLILVYLLKGLKNRRSSKKRELPGDITIGHKKKEEE